MRAGDTYDGISLIRYRKVQLHHHDQQGEEAFASPFYAVPQQQQALARAMAAEEGSASVGPGLHLHAATRKGSSSVAPVPLEIKKYEVVCTKNGADPSFHCGIRRGETLRLLRVEEENCGTASASAAASGVSKGKQQRGGKGGAKQSKKGAREGGGKGEAPVGTEESSNTGTSDEHSRMVFFDGSNRLPCGAEVALTVSFTASIQSFSCGGLYSPVVSSVSPPALLTHFEVHLACAAFPCPDHPAYRIIWTMESLHLPLAYGGATLEESASFVFANSPCVQHTVTSHSTQLRFAPCGPIPAYVLFFGLFTAPLTMASIRLAASSSACRAPCGFERDLVVRVGSSVPCDVDRVLSHAVKAVQLMVDFMDCCIPLLPETAGEDGESAYSTLTVLVVPTVPYIGGMEHHGVIALNRDIFYSSSGGGGGAAKELEQAELIVHEIAHHWCGNAIGMTFAIKEGVCQLLEKYFGPVLLGRLPQKLIPCEEREVEEPTSGKEFTINAYAKALQALQTLVSSRGISHLQRVLQQLVRVYVWDDMVRAGEEGCGCMMMESGGSQWPCAVYLPPHHFLQLLSASS